MAIRLSFQPLYQLFIARTKEVFRTPEAMFWVYIFPVVMIVALGMAFRTQPEIITVAVQEGPQAQQIARSLEGDARFRIEVLDAQEARRHLRVGKSELVVASGNAADGSYEYVFDPTRPGSRLARNATDDILQRAAGREDAFVSTETEVSEPGSRYIDFLVPGLMGMALMGGGMWGVGFAIVDMRIRGVLKRFMGTPMKKRDFLMAMLLSRLLLVIPEIVVVLLCARLLFGVVNHGSFLALSLLVFLGAMQFSGLGLLIASRAKTLEGVSGLMNLVMVPMWIAGGIFFSAERFPEFVQPAIDLLPLTPLIAALRAVMLEGASLPSLGMKLGLIAGWSVISFVCALKLFRWE